MFISGINVVAANFKQANIMGYIIDGIKQGLALLVSFDSELQGIVLLSLLVSGSATLISSFFAVPVGIYLSLKDFRFKRFIVGVINTALAVPPVIIGLLVYLLVSRRGPLGIFEMLFTPYAMLIAQSILAAPIITALTHSALKNISKDTRALSYSLGANRSQMVFALLYQGRFAFLSALIVGFSRVVGETGMALMVGGNIRGMTRVMTTAIALETTKGNFELGIALGMVLLFVAVGINVCLQALQGK